MSVTTNIIFKNATQTDCDSVVVNYQCSHSTPGRDGTCFDFMLSLEFRQDTVTASVNLGEVKRATDMIAIAKMSELLERAALALKTPVNGTIPLFGFAKWEKDQC